MPKFEYIEGTLYKILEAYPKSSELCLSPSSSMTQVLKFNRTGEKKGWGKWLKTWRYNVVLVLYKGRPIGWSWCHNKKINKNGARKVHVICWIYIKEKYRRQGLGTELFNRAKDRAKRNHRPLRVEPHDKRSFAFFEKVNGINIDTNRPAVTPSYMVEEKPKEITVSDVINSGIKQQVISSWINNCK